MKRLTDKKSKNPISSAQGGLCVSAEFVSRLAAIEDILGGDYDIDSLRGDREPVVRCMACEYVEGREIAGKPVLYCARLQIPVWHDFFCAFGVKNGT